MAAEGDRQVAYVLAGQSPSQSVTTDGRGAVHHRDPSDGGHDCEFVHPPPPNFQTLCSICLLVLRTPHLVTCCGHNFCKKCIERVQRSGKCCPLCNEQNFVQAYNRSYDQTLNHFEVYCTHHEDGCEWTGKLEMLDSHLNVNPRIDKKVEGCAYVEVQCFNNGCEQYFQRRVILDHQSRECPLRYFSCEHCHEYESTYRDVTTNHWPVCKCYPLPCPHECRQDTIQRQYLEQHLNEECPLQEVDCEFKYAGCETRLPRKDMAQHLRDGIAHMNLLARQNQLLSQQSQLLSQQNQELMIQLLEKEEQFQRMREDDRREMEEKLTKYQQDSEQRLAEKDKQIKRLSADVQEMRQNMIEEREVMNVELGGLTHSLQSTGSSLEKLRLSEVQKLKNQMGDLTQKQQATKRSLTQLRDSAVRMSEVQKLKNRVGDLTQKQQATDGSLTQLRMSVAPMSEVRTLKSQVDDLTKKHVSVSATVEKLHHHVSIAPLQIIMPDFKQHKDASDDWCSDPFYTHPQGYKVCLKVFANGNGAGEGSHVSCFIYLMRGEFDSHLEWPFRGEFIITLLNQGDAADHHTRALAFDDSIDEASARVTGEGRSRGWGYHRFIPHGSLDYNPFTVCQYLVNDCLHFEVKFILTIL